MPSGIKSSTIMYVKHADCVNNSGRRVARFAFGSSGHSGNSSFHRDSLIVPFLRFFGRVLSGDGIFAGFVDTSDLLRLDGIYKLIFLHEQDPYGR